jgi:polysaccharide deacetylase family protein (PEP-CTERM system associated)
MSLPMTAPVDHLFTVDVEDYFQVNAFEGIVARSGWDAYTTRVERNVDLILELLERKRTLATFFTLGWVADRRPQVVRRIAAAGHEIASHGWWHRRVTQMNPQEFREDLRSSRALLEDVGGQRVFGFRAPSFSILPGMEWAFDLMLEEGYCYDSSLFPIRRPGYGYPGANPAPHYIQRNGGTLLELPPATMTLAGLRLPAAGGGYFRQFPYTVFQNAFARLTRNRVSGVFYIHPWEVDPDQPRLPVGMISRIRHYTGLERTLPRLDRLLSDFRFTSVVRRFGVDAGPSSTFQWAKALAG